jgi:hypothetical protein
MSFVAKVFKLSVLSISPSGERTPIEIRMTDPEILRLTMNGEYFDLSILIS